MNSWGNWYRNEEDNTLEFRPDGSMMYWVDLDRMADSDQVLDWICQVAHKTWCSTETLGNLVRAIDEIVSPQKNLCSFALTRRNPKVEAPAAPAKKAKSPERVGKEACNG